MARDTLASLITTIREMTSAGDSEYTISGTGTYFSDDHIQELLDQNRSDLWDEPLVAIPERGAGGTTSYTEYCAPCQHFEATDGGTAVFVVRDSVGTVKGTATYTPDYLRGRVTFATSQAGSSYYLTGRSYDVYGAAADLLERWTARLKLESFDFETDGQRFTRSQKLAAMQAISAEYRGKQRARSVRMVRGGLNAD